MDILSKLLVSLAIGFLNWYVAREDLENEVREKLALEAAELAKKALAWKANSFDLPDRGSGLRVSNSDTKIKLQSNDPGTKSNADGS
jgi:hypothetical protein